MPDSGLGPELFRTGPESFRTGPEFPGAGESELWTGPDSVREESELGPGKLLTGPGEIQTESGCLTAPGPWLCRTPDLSSIIPDWIRKNPDWVGNLPGFGNRSPTDSGFVRKPPDWSGRIPDLPEVRNFLGPEFCRFRRPPSVQSAVLALPMFFFDPDTKN